ncbi:hypothetical protein HMN09_01266600 [Mycena chlorophos]|uniref:Uncharacterized protein n=1 Tax=Mycena chlorophos TaxID=658473 RepID=A0A8H6VR16_MYCCL|nr:hypothetical protein HMN09_01266600 [Mycena chlorophos]
MPTLLDLPPELLDFIFSSACTDGGRTGRSLSLVSRYVRDISAPFKLQSIALLGTMQLLNFSAFLSRHPSVEARTKFLYIGHPKTIGNDLFDIAHYDKREARGQTGAFWNHWPGIHETIRELKYFGLDELAWGEEPKGQVAMGVLELASSFASDAIFQILDDVAPTLEVLHINLNMNVAHALLRIRDHSSIALPRLVDLATANNFPMKFEDKSQKVQCMLAPSPQLHHLHIIEAPVYETRWTSEAFFCAKGIAHFAPELRTLRFSELGAHRSDGIPACIGRGVGIDVNDIDSRPTSINIVPLPRTLHDIALKPAVGPWVPACEGTTESEMMRYASVVEQARRLAHHSVEAPRKVVLLQADEKRVVEDDADEVYLPELDWLLDEWLAKAESRA